MNRLSASEQDRIKTLALQGLSLRQICASTGFSKNSVMTYRAIALDGQDIKCGCGKDIKHNGWCRHRMTPDRAKAIAALHTNTCADCGGKRSQYTGIRCRDCYLARAKQRAWSFVSRTSKCKICGTIMVVFRDGKNHYACPNDWCQRMYSFYYVEGRPRPFTVRGGKNNELRFDFFLSDYIRRIANEQARS